MRLGIDFSHRAGGRGLLQRGFLWVICLIFALMHCPSCKNATATFVEMQGEYPQVKDLASLMLHLHDTVCLVGTYKWVDFRQHAPGDKTKRYDGYAAIHLKDGTWVHLLSPSLPAAKRSIKERKELEGKRVDAIGIIERFDPSSAGFASLGLPCLITLEKLSLH